MTNDQFAQLNQRLDSIEQRLEEGFSRPASLVLDEVLALEQRTNERLDRLTERVDRLAENQQAMHSTVLLPHFYLFYFHSFISLYLPVFRRNYSQPCNRFFCVI